jgi:hypothetical protein
MANKGAETFFAGLRASVTRYRVEPETCKLYLEKLSRWRLTAAQWTHALDTIIEQYTDGSLPPLGAIFEYLKSAQASSQDSHEYGWLTFTDAKGYNQAMRIRNVNGRWMQVVIQHKPDTHYHAGKRPEFTDQVKEITLPAGAVDEHYCPDSPAETGDETYRPVDQLLQEVPF